LYCVLGSVISVGLHSIEIVYYQPLEYNIHEPPLLWKFFSVCDYVIILTRLQEIHALCRRCVCSVFVFVLSHLIPVRCVVADLTLQASVTAVVSPLQNALHIAELYSCVE
jgi:hypothetical protein